MCLGICREMLFLASFADSFFVPPPPHSNGPAHINPVHPSLLAAKSFYMRGKLACSSWRHDQSLWFSWKWTTVLMSFDINFYQIIFLLIWCTFLECAMFSIQMPRVIDNISHPYVAHAESSIGTFDSSVVTTYCSSRKWSVYSAAFVSEFFSNIPVNIGILTELLRS